MRVCNGQAISKALTHPYLIKKLSFKNHIQPLSKNLVDQKSKSNSAALN